MAVHYRSSYLLLRLVLCSPEAEEAQITMAIPGSGCIKCYKSEIAT
jgi:hypothetical protein